MERLASALDESLDAAADGDVAQAERSRAMVREHFTIQRMSAVLGRVYRGVAREEASLEPMDAAR